jgi:hypothetical protein
VNEALYTVPLPVADPLPELAAGAAGDEETGWRGGTIFEGEATATEEDVGVIVNFAVVVGVVEPGPTAMTPEVARH